MSSLKVLVGSANLGNAKPNPISLHAWIPDDGDCQQVLQHQKYPLQSADISVPGGAKSSNRSQQKRFDLIVIGLQESTFEVVPSTEHNATDHVTSTEEEDATTDSTRKDDKSNQRQESTTKPAPDSKKAKSKGSKLRKVAKVTQKVATFVASRDHTDTTTKAAEVLPDGTNALHDMLAQRLPSYQRILSFQRGEMRLLIYARLDDHNAKQEINSNTTTTTRRNMHSVQVRSVRAQNTGVAGLANKGGIVAEVVVNEGTVLSFVTCHLEAHEGIDKFATRCSTMGDILRGTTQKGCYPDVSLASHFCFVLGDLNFRTRYQGHVHYEDQINDVQKLVADCNWEELNAADELQMALHKKLCLYGFQTLSCHFPPTFKMERRPGYTYKENRTPSYTDRILWKTGDRLEENITPLCYEPVDDFETSDHKPVRGAFEIQLNNHLRLRGRHLGYVRALFLEVHEYEF